MYSTHYSNPDSLINLDVAILASATKTLDIAAYTLVDAELITAIHDASVRGVAVRLYLDRTELEAEARGNPSMTGKPLAMLVGLPNVAIKVKESSILMHLKSYLVDSTTLRDGSANFSTTGEIQQDNSVTFTDDAEAVGRFAAKFAAMWARPDNLTVDQAIQPHAIGTSHHAYQH